MALPLRWRSRRQTSPPSSLAASVLVAALCCCGPLEARGQLLKQLGHITPAKLTAPLASKSPAQIAEAIKDKATSAASKLEDLAASAPKNVSEAIDAVSPQKQNVEHALEAAGSALQKGANAVANAKKGDVQGKLKDSAESLTGGASSKVEDAVKSMKPDDVASALRGATPKVANTLNRTSQHIAETLKNKSPELVGKITSQGMKVADSISPGSAGSGAAGGAGAADGTDLTGQGVLQDKGFSTPVAAIALLILAAGSGYVVFQRFKGQSQRSPVLLSEALEVVRTGPSRSHPGMQTAQEPFFTQF